MCLRVISPAVTWEPVLGLLQLLCALDGVRLILGPPLGNLAVGLGQCPLQLGLGFLLLLVLFPQQVTVVAGGLQGVRQGVLGLRITVVTEYRNIWPCSKLRHFHLKRHFLS